MYKSNHKSILIFVLISVLIYSCKFPECKTEQFEVEASTLIKTFYADQIDDTVVFSFNDSGLVRNVRFLVIENAQVKDNRFQYEDADCECSRNIFNTLSLSYQNLENPDDTLRVRLIRDNQIAAQCEEYFNYTLSDRQFDFVISFRGKKLAKISDHTLNNGAPSNELINNIIYDSVYTYPLFLESSNNKQIFIKPNVGLMKIQTADIAFERVL